MNQLSAAIILLCLPAAILSGTLPDGSFTAGRIVGGSTATLGQFPHQAALRSAANEDFCGGSIIGTRTILTAAHCTVGRTNANTKVVVGTISRLAGGTTYSTLQIINHGSFNATTLENDISMIKVLPTIAFGTNVNQIALETSLVTSGSATVSGWGLTSYPGVPANNLQFLETQVITNQECKDLVPVADRDGILSSNVCTLNSAGSGACHGDSGGPLVYNGKFTGIVSRGYPCALGRPDIFTRVSTYVPWINAQGIV